MSAQPELIPPHETGEEASPEAHRPRLQGITPRAFIVGLILIPIMCFWNEYTEIVAQATDLAAMSLIIAVVFALFVLISLNLFLKRFLPRWAFSQAELMYIYLMQTVSIGISGIGMMQFLNTFVGNIFYFGTPENQWKEKFLPVARPWLLPDPTVVKPYYMGQSTFWTLEHLRGWMAPILVWSAYIFVLLWVMLCLNTLFRKQWMERERLSFPITSLPLEITREGGAQAIFGNRLLWFGFFIPVVLESLASLHFLYPSVPYLPIKPGEPSLNLTPYFSGSRPWSGMGDLQLSFYPLVIGLTYFLPLDVAFSLWFFYLFTKGENIMATAMGFRDPGASLAMSRIPYVGEQSAGAFIGVAFFALYSVRKQIGEMLRHALRPRRELFAEERNEPMSYRMALFGGLAGVLLLVAFGAVIGMAWYLPVLFYFVFYLYVIAFTRIRAEAGLPWGFGPDMNVHQLFKAGFGTQSFSLQDTVGLQMLLWHDLDYRCTNMPNQLEALKIGKEVRMNLRHIVLVILISIAVGALSSWAAVLTVYYQHGAATAKVNDWRTDMGNVPWNDMADWINNPTKIDGPRLQGVGIGFAATAFLLQMRQRFLWWPFHPIGYAVAGTFTMQWLWCATLIGWLAKAAVIRYGGMKTYRRYIPFFIGLILGDYITGSVWAIYGSVTGITTYRAFPI